MKKVLLFSLVAFILVTGLQAQVTCNATSFDVDLSASIDTSVSFQSTRNGDCCTGTNCIRFNLTLNPACSYVNFNVANPAPPGNSAYYQIDCGTPTSLGTPICIVGKTNVVITFCKPGNDNPIYTIVAAGALRGSDDITVREGCTGSLSVSGLQTATINWTSIYPGAAGAYNSWLSCTSGCTSVNVIPQTGAPSYVDYQVSGYRLCGPLVYDTIRVYTTPQIGVSISPDNASVCAGGSSSVSLTATASGGDAPYNFLWNTGQSGPSITVSTGATYSVSVTDVRNCLPAVQQVLVKTTPLPQAPLAGSNSPVCAGSSLQLTASTITGAVYAWTGPNGFTSSLQNPVIQGASASDAGSYSVTATVGQCTSLAATISVVVNAIPVAPVAGNNSPVCAGGSLGLTAGSISGASYSWSGPAGFSSTAQNPVISSATPAGAGTYSVTAIVNGCSSAPATTQVLVYPLPPAPVVTGNTPLCAGSSLALNAATIVGASYNWTGPGGFSSSLQSPIITNTTIAASGSYSVRATVNGCMGPASSIPVIVYPIPQAPLVASNSPVCEGSNLSLTASSIAGATYSWTGPAGFSSVVQNPLITGAPLAASGVYSAIVTVNGCSSVPANLSVSVQPVPAPPVVTGNTTLCEGSAIQLSASGLPGASYGWTGPGSFTSGGSSIMIPNAGILQTGTYSVTQTVNGCTSAPGTSAVIVYQLPVAPSVVANSPVCSGSTILLNAAALAGASYSWTGPGNFSSSLQNPTINNASLLNAGDYLLSVSINGCSSATSTSTNVVVRPTPVAPLVTNNGPLCEGSTLVLSATAEAGVTYSWLGPAGFISSNSVNNVFSVTKANAGTYSVSVSANGCTSPVAFTAVGIDPRPLADAGGDKLVCSNSSLISLSGSVSGGGQTGLWTTNGTGSFTNASSLGTGYYPSAADTAAGSVHLWLTSTNNGSCAASSSGMVIHFTPPPSSDAGRDQVICASDPGVILQARFSNAAGGIWSTSGDGRFSPSLTSAAANYTPGMKDKTEGNIQLIWTTTGNGPCAAAADGMVITVRPVPVVSTGTTLYVLENNSVALNPSVKGSRLSYSWTPATFLSSDTVPNPICTPKSTISYHLFVRDTFGCSSSGDLMVKLIRNPVIPNVFTPNGDGINDTWQIRNLSDYDHCVVNIYDRYGQPVYESSGYSRAWDGTCNGRALPAATYYYIIDLKTGAKPLSGFVDIVR